jgi:hypothetical protein
MTWFGFVVLGFVVAVIVVAVRADGRCLAAELRRGVHWPLESDGIDLDIPAWVNDSRPLEQRFIEAVHFAQWEGEWKREGEDA